MANLKLLGASSGYTEVSAAPNAVPTTFILPSADGTAGQILSTDGAGQLAFITNQAASYTLPAASVSVLGGVRVDGTTITINGSGIISSASAYTLPTASGSILGGVKVGTGLSILAGVLSVATDLAAGSLQVIDDNEGPNTYRTARVDTATEGTPNSIACRDIEGNLNAVFFQGTATSSLFADLAEKYIADAVYDHGTVLEFGGAHEVTIAEAETTKVAGVVSTSPGFIMNSGLECSVSAGERTAVVALQGRVPVKVKGVVRKGDMMVSAGNGFAKASDAPAIGTIIGKALENFDGPEGVIEVVVGRI
jgi:hypothetical protein